jgi:hypothetical protein
LTYPKHACRLGLEGIVSKPVLAIDQFVIPQIVALPLDQVERDQRHLMIVTAGAQRVEIGKAVIAANHRLAIDQERSRPDRAGGLHDGRKPIGPIRPAS